MRKLKRVAQHRSVLVGAWMPRDLVARMDAAAAREDRRRSSFLRRAVESYLERKVRRA